MMDWGGFIMNLVELDAPNHLVRLREKGNIIVRPLAHPITDCNLKDPSMLLFLADICFQSTQLACLLVGIVTFNQKVNCHVFVVHSQQTIQHSDGKGSSGNEINRTFVDKHPPIPTDDANVIRTALNDKRECIFPS
jgi:hypothetical protein